MEHKTRVPKSLVAIILATFIIAAVLIPIYLFLIKPKNERYKLGATTAGPVAVEDLELIKEEGNTYQLTGIATSPADGTLLLGVKIRTESNEVQKDVVQDIKANAKNFIREEYRFNNPVKACNVASSSFLSMETVNTVKSVFTSIEQIIAQKEAEGEAYSDAALESLIDFSNPVPSSSTRNGPYIQQLQSHYNELSVIEQQVGTFTNEPMIGESMVLLAQGVSSYRQYLLSDIELMNQSASLSTPPSLMIEGIAVNLQQEKVAIQIIQDAKSKFEKSI